MKVTRFVIVAILSLATVLAPRNADAALTWLGVGMTAAFGGVLDDVAYDDKHDVYLHVWEGGRTIWGRFIGGDGTPKGGAFVVPTAYYATFAGAPKVAYSAGTTDDVFFVGFSSDHSWPDRGKNVFGQMVRFTGTGATGGEFVGTSFPLSPFSVVPTVFQTMNDVVYNRVQRQFYTVWDDSRGSTDVFGRAFDVNGAPVAAEINISNAPLSQGAASLAVDAEHNRYFVAYQGLHPASPAFPEITGAWGKILDGTTGAPVTGLIEMQVGGAPLEANVVYLPEKDTFLAYWTGFAGDGRRVFGRQVPANYDAVPAFATGVYPVMSLAGEGGADGSYNAKTETVLLAAMHISGRVKGAELNRDGNIVTPSFTMSTVLQRYGSYWPRVTDGPNGHFGFVYGVDYSTAWLERYQGVTVNTPVPPTPNPLMAIDTPRSGIVSNPIWFAGWASDLGAPTGTGVDTIHIWAWPDSGGPPTWAGAVTPNLSRPDVGNVFGLQFTNTGFGLLLNPLAPGTYSIVAYMHSTVAGTFNLSQGVRVTIAEPLMSIDTPSPNSIVSKNGFMIGGWALDRGASSGTGVDTLHMWAWPTNGAPPIWAGVATYGGVRPDLGAILGPQFTNCGFNALVTLPPGVYDLAVYSHSSVTNSFSMARLVRIVVQ